MTNVPDLPLTDYLDQREAELQRRVDEMYSTLRPLEAELAHVRRARATVSQREGEDRHHLLPMFHLATPAGRGKSTRWQSLLENYHTLLIEREGDDATKAQSEPKVSPYLALTQKELVVKALKEQFPNGATANELVDFFHKGWGRVDVVRSSLSPQLSRLKKEGKIALHGSVWTLLKKEEAPDQGASDSSSREGGRPAWAD